MWHTCAQGYQKCDMRHVQRLPEMWHEVCALLSEMWHEDSTRLSEMWWGICTGLSEMFRRHVHRVIRNVTRDMCPGLSEMWHVHRVMRNVTLDMHTALSEMWHETCVLHYQKSLITMNNELYSQWLLYICIPSYSTITYPYTKLNTQYHILCCHR